MNHHPISKLKEKMSPEQRRNVTKKVALLEKEMALGDLRQAVNMTQTELAEKLHINQASVSKFENQSDIYISTLRRILSGMGGELHITARFPDSEVEINQFNELHHTPAAMA